MRIFVLFLILLNSGECLSEVFRYVDSSGKAHYVSSKEAVPARYQSQLKNAPALPNIGKAPSKSYTNSPRTRKTARPTVLVMRGCGYCNMLEKLLNDKQIAYTRYDIHTSRKGEKLYNQLGRGGVPITKIDSTVIRGYQPGPILSALGKN